MRPGRNWPGNHIQTYYEALFKNLSDFIPNELWDESSTTFGCPDCYDQGGIFIKYKNGSNSKNWKIDQTQIDIPTYLHEFIDMVNEKIQLING